MNAENVMHFGNGKKSNKTWLSGFKSAPHYFFEKNVIEKIEN